MGQSTALSYTPSPQRGGNVRHFLDAHGRSYTPAGFRNFSQLLRGWFPPAGRATIGRNLTSSTFRPRAARPVPVERKPLILAAFCNDHTRVRPLVRVHFTLFLSGH